jgi:SAM-dependent methyltransferase
VQDPWDLDAAFDQDYLDFYATCLTDEVTSSEAAVVAGLLEVAAGERVLDLACGDGRIAVDLAVRGCDVTGVDRSPLLLAGARERAETTGVTLSLVEQDMRSLDVGTGFDAALCWFTSFGYSDDAQLRAVLRHLHDALAPGGRLLLESLNIFQVAYEGASCEVLELGLGELMVDRRHFDPATGRQHCERTITRPGRAPRSVSFWVRLFAPTEICAWLEHAGFTDIQFHDGDGDPFEADSARMVVLARRNA